MNSLSLCDMCRCAQEALNSGSGWTGTATGQDSATDQVTPCLLASSVTFYRPLLSKTCLAAALVRSRPAAHWWQQTSAAFLACVVFIASYFKCMVCLFQRFRLSAPSGQHLWPMEINFFIPKGGGWEGTTMITTSEASRSREAALLWRPICGRHKHWHTERRVCSLRPCCWENVMKSWML